MDTNIKKAIGKPDILWHCMRTDSERRNRARVS